MSKPSDIEKYIYLRDLQNSNETLFYNLIVKHLEEMLPIIYTPTVGLGCQRFSHIYRHARGLFISYPHKDKIDKILSTPQFDLAEVIVVSDGERILGLGDQGAGGMGIPIGKLSLYTACAGIHPGATLPILLDTGTNNPDLLKDPLYIGWRHERIRGKDYDDFIELFIQAVCKKFPNILLQWEDFAQHNANTLLERYSDRMCTFNDDIQGTAATVLGVLLSAICITQTPLTEQRFVIAGAGSAGCGICQLIARKMVQEGLSEADALSRFFLIDREGLLIEEKNGILPFQKRFCQKPDALAKWKVSNPNNITLKEVIVHAKPTILIGVSGQGGVFTEEVVRAMAANVKRPIIFPLSNPTSKSEARPEDLLKWTQDRAIISTGSPFPPLKKGRIDQTNNSYIFPGLGLGAIAAKAPRITEAMIFAAAETLAALSPSKNDPSGNLLPPLSQIRDVSFHIALAVAKASGASGNLEEKIRAKIWNPVYLPYRKLPSRTIA